MREQLRRFTDFAAMPAPALDAVAARARRLRVPARRWLVRPGRLLSGRFYLLEGRIQLIEAGRSVIVNAGSARARRAVYPGASGVETLTPALFVSVDPALLDAPDRVDPRASLGVPEVNAGESSWQRRFLTSPLMQRLDPAAWQRILRAMSRRHVEAGEPVVRLGERADCCYVLSAGAAEIHDATERVVATLAPGHLFGEDALVSGGARNASVVMTCAGSVVSLAADCFQSWLLDAVVWPVASTDGRRTISLEPHRPADVWLPVDELRSAGARLPPGPPYVIVGAGWRARALAAFLLAEQGIDARPLAAPDPLMPARCGPGPSP
jgi:CRP-like cAMP-binding protein